MLGSRPLSSGLGERCEYGSNAGAGIVPYEHSRNTHVGIFIRLPENFRATAVYLEHDCHFWEISATERMSSRLRAAESRVVASIHQRTVYRHDATGTIDHLRHARIVLSS